jgi:anti-sigma B factor antagonist
VIELKGRLTHGSAPDLLREAITRALGEGAQKIVLDLSECTTIDSTGIGELVAAYTIATSRGARLKLGGLTPKVADVLTITQLITVFEVHEDAAAAAASFES